MSGCYESYAQDAKLTARYELLKKAVKAVDADFVGLADTFKWKETFSPSDLRRDFDYKNIFLIDMEDTRVESNIGVAVMTNLDVQGFNTTRAFNRNCIETKLNGLTVYTCYLDDISEDTRLFQIKSLLSQTAEPAIIHGDLNTFSKEDLLTVDRISPSFEEANPGLSAKLKPIIEDMRRCAVVDELTTCGFKDSAEKWMPTMPTKLFPATGVNEPFLRVDYIFHTAGVFVEDLTVPKGDLFDEVSDHFPLVAAVTAEDR